MNCFGFGEDSSRDPQASSNGLDGAPTRTKLAVAPKPKPKPKHNRKNSLSVLLGSLLTPPSTPVTSPTFQSSSSNKCRSWAHGQRPTISNPRPLSFYSAEPNSDLSRAVRAAFEGLHSPIQTPDLETPPWTSNIMEGSNSSKVSLLHPATASSARLKQRNDAQDMTERVEERAKKVGLPVPPYEFLELIGKGAFGRVFKCRSKKDQGVVAVKVIEIDKSDYKLATVEKDQAIKDFVTEISILHTLKDSRAKNINIIHEAFNFHSQLWIVSEYCPGGSVHTLLRASPKPGLEEKYIIAISRELAIALKYVHEAGIIHRDVKAANVLITQDGQLQLCDFGVSGILESNSGKRSTIIGSPYWMAPEMHEEDEKRNPYGTEVDCWAFGCTVYELATGQPPNSNVAPHRLHMFLSRAPRLEGDEYPAGLREFVSFCLEERPEDRPTADGILKHTYVANTSKKYPTPILRQLVERFAKWESAGGQRQSLLPQFGATRTSVYDPSSGDEVDEWNFSTTDDFAEQLLNRFAPRTPDTMSPEGDADEETPRQKSAKPMTPFEKAKQEDRAQRGGRKMARLFDENAEPYDYDVDDEDAIYMSDLPLRRRSASGATDRETIIDLDAARLSQDVSSMTNLDLAGAETIKASRGRLRFLDEDDEDENYQNRDAKRLTRDWTFPGTNEPTAPATDRPRTLDWTMSNATAEAQARYESQSADDESSEASYSRHPPPHFRPMLKHTTTEPVGSFGDFRHHVAARDIPTSELSYEPPDRSSMIDIDDAGFSTLSRQDSFASTVTDPNADPFYLDDEEGNNGNTIRAKRSESPSLHSHSQSNPSAADSVSTGYPDHARGNSSSSQSERHERPDYSASSASLSRNFSASTTSQYDDLDFIPHSASNPNLYEGIPPYGGRNYILNPPVNAFVPVHSATASDADSTQGSSMSGPPADVTVRAGQHSSRRGNRGRQSRNNRGRGNRDRRGDPVPDATDEDAAGSLRRHVVNFPQPQPVNPAALQDDADMDLVASELERLLGAFTGGLHLLGELLADVDQEDEDEYAGEGPAGAGGYGYDGTVDMETGIENGANGHESH